MKVGFKSEILLFLEEVLNPEENPPVELPPLNCPFGSPDFSTSSTNWRIFHYALTVTQDPCLFAHMSCNTVIATNEVVNTIGEVRRFYTRLDNSGR